VASQLVPESCAAHREGRRDALTGGRDGQPSRCDADAIPGADAVCAAAGNTTVRAIASARVTRRGLSPQEAARSCARLGHHTRCRARGPDP
jgi:hypothetical protein